MIAQSSPPNDNYQALYLLSMNAAQNRYRGYRIELCELSGSGYRVATSWGRMPHWASRKLVREFPDFAAAERYLATVLAVRRQHGYRLEYISGGFPQTEGLLELTWCPERQMRLWA